MNLLKTFESRVSNAFGAAPRGYAAPFSFKKLAKKTASELESETLSIDGVETAPALYTIFVSRDDDIALRPLYESINREVTSFIEAHANSKGYVFVGKPLTRFMVNPRVRSGKFEVHAENVDARTLARLRAEEEAFLARPAGAGIGALQPIQTPATQAAPQPTRHPQAAPAPRAAAHGEFAPVVDAAAEPDSSSGLNVIPNEVVDEALQAPTPMPAHAAPRPAPAVPRTQRRESFVAAEPQAPAQAEPAPRPVASCMLIDRQSGATYRPTAPVCALGRERVTDGVVVRDPNVSRRHAELAYDGRHWRITDLNSTNGTLVNDIDVDSCVLRSGDVITLGLTNLEFRES